VMQLYQSTNKSLVASIFMSIPLRCGINSIPELMGNSNIGIAYHIYSRISRFFCLVKREFPEAFDLYTGHISYQPKERCFRPSLTLNTIGFNPIRTRVGIKSSHRSLLTQYYSINNN